MNREIAFKRWFEGSKVVDAEGTPLVVYHGTTADFVEFSQAKSRNASGFSPTNRLGFFFTERAEGADRWSLGGRNQAGANTMPVYLSIKNPKRLSLGAFKKIMQGAMDPDTVLAVAQKTGHDGFVVDYGPWHDVASERWHIAFHPGQIKSATGNCGAFDSTNTSILA